MTTRILAAVTTLNTLLACGHGHVVQTPGQVTAAERAYQTRKETVHGVIVEEVGENSTLAKAGIESGDRLLTWQRLPSPPANPDEASGDLLSPFDWTWVVLEQAPRGTIEIVAERDGTGRVFKVEPGRWEAEVRPSMASRVLADYDRGRRQLKRGRLEKTARAWEQCARSAEDQDTRVWLWLRVATLWAGKGEWKSALEAYQSGLEAAQAPFAQSLLWHAIAEAHTNLNAFDRAQHAYDAARETRASAWGEESLAVAVVVSDLGALAWHRGNVGNALAFIQHALHTREKLAPGSLEVAASLNDLGIVVQAQGDLTGARTLLERALHIRETVAPRSPDTAASLNTLGVLARSEGDLHEANQFFQSALALHNELGRTSIEMSSVLNNLGSMAQAQGNFHDAQEYYERTLQIRRRLAPGSLAVATSLNNLGTLAGARGHLEQAANYFQRSLAIRQGLAPGSLAVASSLHNLGSVARALGDLQLAMTYLERALEIRQRLAPKSLELADSMTSLGVVAQSLTDLELAEELHQSALEIQRQLAPNSLAMARILNNLGAVSSERGDLRRAKEFFLRAFELHKALAPSSLDVAMSLSNLGGLTYKTGDLERASDYFQRSLDIRQRLAPNSLAVASSFDHLGSVATERGDLKSATEFFLRALEIRQRHAPQGLDVANSLNNLGGLAHYRGNLEHAMEYYEQALEIYRQVVPDSSRVATCLNNLGVVARDRGDLERARRSYELSLDIRKKTAPGSLEVASSFNNLGTIALDQGDLDLADRLLSRALRIRQRWAPGSLIVAHTLTNLGSVARRRGDLERAMDFYERALGLLGNELPESVFVAANLNNRGAVALDLGEVEKARLCFTKALEIWESLAPDTVVAAKVLHSLGVLHRKKDPPELVTADNYLQRALGTLESQLARLGGAHDLRGRFRGHYHEFYRDALEVELELGDKVAAFHTLERGRARTFLEQLEERDLVFSTEMPKELDEERRRIAVLFDRRHQGLAQLSSRHHAEEIEEIQEELERLRDRAEDVEEKIRRTSPRLASLRYPRILGVDATRRALDAGTLLLSYSVDKESIIVFSLSPGEGLRVNEILTSEADLRDQVTEFRTLIQTYREPTANARLGVERIAAEAEVSQSSRLDSLARSLYSILFGPVADRVHSAERLLILPDGPLHFVPWGALIQDTGQFLIEHRPIHLALSATVYAELRDQRSDEPRDPTDVKLVAFGDPLYPGSQRAAAEHRDVVLRSIAERSPFHWTTLPHTGREVEGIAGLYPGPNVRAYLGSQATEERAKTLGRDVRIVHIAAHGFLDERFPLNSFLALSIPRQFVEGSDNGLLQAWEIIEAIRLDADLVVLSACESGIGEEVLIGLTRAFQYAGARSVLASLWSVADDATAELMIRFHRHLHSGKPIDEALRHAQIELIRAPIKIPSTDGQYVETDVSAPYFWAAFQLIGDWR